MIPRVMGGRVLEAAISKVHIGWVLTKSSINCIRKILFLIYCPIFRIVFVGFITNCAIIGLDFRHSWRKLCCAASITETKSVVFCIIIKNLRGISSTYYKNDSAVFVFMCSTAFGFMRSGVLFSCAVQLLVSCAVEFCFHAQCISESFFKDVRE